MKVTRKRKKVITKNTITDKQNKSLEELEVIENDPRKTAFALYYFDPTSQTYSNALQSAVKAGFTETYANNIMSLKPKWLSEIIGRMDMIDSVKRNIKKHLDLKTEVPVMTAFGPYIDKTTNKVMMREDPKMLKIQQDMTMFVAEKIVDGFKKIEKDNPLGSKVEIKQIFILSPTGEAKSINSINVPNEI